MRSDDESLVEHCLSGDTDAFGVLVHKYQEMVYAYAFQKTGSDADAKDVAQEVFLRAYRYLGKLKYPHQFRTWLYTIMSNECNRWLVRASRHRIRETNLDDAAEASLQYEPAYAGSSDDWSMDVKEALAKLPEDNRIVVSMFYMSDRSLKEIGEFLGVSANTVKGKLYRARQQLGRTLSERYGRNMQEHKLKGEFLMQTMERLSQIPRPIISPTWRGQISQHIPFAIAATLCALIGILGVFSDQPREIWPLPEYSSPAIITANFVTDVELMPLDYSDVGNVPLMASGNPDSMEQTDDHTRAVDSTDAPLTALEPGNGFNAESVLLASAGASEKKEQMTVSGKVVKDNAPVSNAKVYVCDMNTGVKHEGSTTSDGSFRIEIIKPEKWNRVATVAQHPSHSFGWTKLSQSNATNVIVTLREPTMIAGTITDKQGKPIQGADVRMYSIVFPFPETDRPILENYLFGDAIPVPAVKTKADGKFTFSNLPKGSGANIDVAGPGYAKARITGMQAGSSGLAFKMERAGSIAGRVVFGDTGKTAAGIGISASGIYPTSSWAKSRTDEKGYYVLDSLSRGEYVVFLTEKLPDWTAVAQEHIQIAEGQSVKNVDLKLVKGGFITGKIINKDTNEPIPGHGISIYDASRPETQASIHSVGTDKNGSYRFRAAPGKARVYTSAPGGYQFGESSKDVNVAEGETVSNVDFQFSKAVQMTVTGKTISVNGDPVAGALITDRQRTFYQYGISDSKGVFTIKGMVPGQRVFLRAMQTELQLRGVADAEIQPDAVLEIVMEKYETVNMSGKVVDGLGVPIASANIILTKWNDETGGGGIGTTVGMTDQTGSYEVKDLIVGDVYSISAAAEGYQGGGIPRFTAQAGTQRLENIEMRPPVKYENFMKGRITDTDGKQIAGARVDVGHERAVTDENGYYRLDNLPGKVAISVYIDHPDYGHNSFGYIPANETRNFVVPKAERYLAGKVVDAEGNPVAGVSVGIDPHRDAETGHVVISSSTNLKGEFRVKNIIQDRVSVHLSSNIMRFSRMLEDVETNKDDVVFVFDKSLRTLGPPQTPERTARLEYANQALKRIEELPGKPAPELDVAEWLHGKPVKIADLKGKIVLLYFWTSDSRINLVSRLQSIRLLNVLEKEYGKDGLVCIGVYEAESKPDELKQLMKQEGCDFRIAVDKPSPIPGAKGVTFDRYANPFLCPVIDRSGIVVANVWDHNIEEKIRELLDSGK